MRLNRTLARQFVRATNDSATEVTQETVYGTVVQNGDRFSVRIDGSDSYIECDSTVSYNEGDRVIVNITDHTPTVTGNLTDKAVGEETAKTVATVAADNLIDSKMETIVDEAAGSVIQRISGTYAEKTDTPKSVLMQYALSDSEITPPSEGDWSTVAPTWVQGKYMWQRTVTIYADDTESNPHRYIGEPTCISGAKGDPGQDGQPGAKGDKGDKGDPGQDGQPGVKGDKGDPGQDGIDGQPGAPGEKGDKGDPGQNGAPGEKGDKGDPGQDGAPGVSIVAVTPIYWCTSSTEGKPDPPPKNTKVIENNPQTYGEWNLQPAEWDSIHQVYFICSQIEYDDGSVDFSEVVKDSSLSKVTSEIIQQADKIALKVDSNVYNTQIEVMQNAINSKVSENVLGEQVYSLIEQMPDTIQIQAKNINLNGVVTANETFEIDAYGNVNVIGGHIAGFSIYEDRLSSFADYSSGIEATGVTLSAIDGIIQDALDDLGNGYETFKVSQHAYAEGGITRFYSRLFFKKQLASDRSTEETVAINGLTGNAKFGGAVTCGEVKTSSGADLDSVKTKVDGSLKSTFFASAYGTSSAYPSVDISSLASGTRIRIEVGVPIDNNGTIAWFSYSTLKSSSTTDYLLNVGGYYYSSTYCSSVFINLSNTRITINNGWTKVIGGTANTNVTNLKSLSRIYVYTENL